MCVGKFCLGCSQRETSLTNFCIRGENWGSISHRSSSSGWDTNCGSCGKTAQGSSDVHVSASGPSAPLPDCGQQVCPAYCCLCSQHNRNLLDIFGVKTLNTQAGGFLERLSLGQDRQSFVTSLLGELTAPLSSTHALMEAKRLLFLCSIPHARRLGACYSLVRFPPSAEPPSAHEESVDNVHLPRPGNCPSLGEDQLLLCCMPWMLVTWREGTQDTFGPDQCFPSKEESYPIKIFKQVYVCKDYHCNDVCKRLFPLIPINRGLVDDCGP